MVESLLVDMVAAILAATLFAYIASIARQPLILGYVLAGLAIGPLGLGIITKAVNINMLSQLGMVFLLFITGMEVDMRRLRGIGAFATAAGIIQVLLTLALGFYAASYFGFTQAESVYIGLILAFSSTMVVIKLLLDRREIDTLHGGIMIGVLLVQDLIAVIALAIIGQGTIAPIDAIALSIFKGLGLFAIALLFSSQILPIVFKYATRSQELLLMTAVSMCFLFSGLAYLLGFSVAVGAFIAGVGIATFPYNYEIIGRTNALRDYFATIFFVSLGMQIGNVSGMFLPALAFLAIVLIAKPAILFTLSLMHGYEPRTSLLLGIGLAQISEFSLILASLGFSLGVLSSDALSLTTLLAILTITLTPYIMSYGNSLYLTLSGVLISASRLLPVKRKILEGEIGKLEGHTILFGCHRMGASIADTLLRMKKNLVIADYDPEVIKRLITEGKPCIYGDLRNTEVLERLEIGKARMIISTTPEETDNEFILRVAKEKNPKCKVIVRAHHLESAKKLYDAGADYVVMPEYLSGKALSGHLTELISSEKKAAKLREAHIGELDSMWQQRLNYKLRERQKNP